MDKDYIGLQDLSERISLSKRTIRTWILDPSTPMPHFHVGGKLLFRICEVDKWIEQFRGQSSNVDKLIDEIIKDIERR